MRHVGLLRLYSLIYLTPGHNALEHGDCKRCCGCSRDVAITYAVACDVSGDREVRRWALMLEVRNGDLRFAAHDDPVGLAVAPEPRPLSIGGGLG